MRVWLECLAKLVMLRRKVPHPTTPRRSLKEAIFYKMSCAYIDYLSRSIRISVILVFLISSPPFHQSWSGSALEWLEYHQSYNGTRSELRHGPKARGKGSEVLSWKSIHTPSALIVEVALILDRLSNPSTDFPLNPVGERGFWRGVGQSEDGV